MSSSSTIFYVPRGRRRFFNVTVVTDDSKQHAQLHSEDRDIGVCFCGRRCHGRCRKCGWEQPERRRGRLVFEDELDAALRLSLKEQAKRKVVVQH